MNMLRKIIYSLTFIVSLNVGAQTSAEGHAKLAVAKEYEQRLYPSFTQEIFTKTVDAYHDAGTIFLALVSKQKENKLQNSYYALYAWLQEAELLEALNRSRLICDIYVNSFDQFIPAAQYKEYTPTDISQLQYDTTYTKTLWLLFYKTQECHKDMFTVKYGELLKKYINQSNSSMPELYIAVMQAYVNVDLYTESFLAFQDYLSKCKGMKLTSDQKLALKKAATDLKNKSTEALSAEQKKQLEKCC